MRIHSHDFKVVSVCSLQTQTRVVGNEETNRTASSLGDSLPCLANSVANAFTYIHTLLKIAAGSERMEMEERWDPPGPNLWDIVGF